MLAASTINPSTGPSSAPAGRSQAPDSRPAQRLVRVEPLPLVDVLPPQRGGLRSWAPLLNQQSTSAQQALGFLDEASEQLQAIKSDLGTRLVAKTTAAQPQNGALAEKLRQFNGHWRQRTQASGGSLDPQLAYSGSTPAQQRFTMRGLDLQALKSGEKEALSFAVAGSAPRTVALEPGLADDAIVQRLDQGLAPANIRAAKDAQGGVVFSTPESNWAAVRDSLSLKGGGMRFPAGQFNRVLADAEPEAVQPQIWQANDAEGVRQTLQKVLQAMDRVRQARTAVGGELAQVAQQLADSKPSQDGTWAASFAQDFQTVARDPRFQSFADMSAALTGVRRERVTALLALR